MKFVIMQMCSFKVTYCSIIYLLLNFDIINGISLPSTEINALHDIFISLKGSSWSNKNWNFTSNNVSGWHGITYTQSGSSYYISSLQLQSNKLIGTLPSTLGKMKMLTYIDFSGNKIVGSIPSTIGGLSSLAVLRLYKNSLSGSIPSQLGYVTTLSYLSLYSNKLSGIIPSSIGVLTNLMYLALYTNKLTKTIPSAIGNLAGLSFLRLYNNLLTGAIPTSLTQLPIAKIIRLSTNSLTGTLPSFRANHNLIWLDCGKNSLTGTLPSSFSTLLGMSYLFLQQNSLSGTIPSIWVDMQPLILRLDSNRLTGTIPSSFANMTYLSVLMLSKNRFRGDPTFVFNVTNQRSLSNIDLSSNRFSGPLPDQVFMLRNLTTFAATDNCFYGSLPNTICSASKLRVLSLAGLRNEYTCLQIMDFSVRKPALSKEMQGSIPACIWSMSSLTSLQLSGNGLSGQLYTPPKYSNLRILRLSSNNIGGTAPEEFQRFPFTTLDLSFNKIQGTWENLAKNFNVSSSVLDLSVNRLSGELSHGLKTAKFVNVLVGNVFDCDSLPDHDPIRDSYVCESKGYDNALQMFGYSILFNMVIGMLALVLLICFSYGLRKQSYQFRSWFTGVGTNVMPTDATVRRVLTKCSVDGNDGPVLQEDLQEVQGFVDVLRLSRKWATMIIIIILFVCLPLYPSLKLYINGGAFDMLTVQYNWAVSGVFLSGVGPALLLFFLWNFILFLYTFMVATADLYNVSVVSASTLKEKKKAKLHKIDHALRILENVLTVIVVAFDIFSVLVLNGCFIIIMLSDYSSSAKAAAQFGKGIFDAGLDVLVKILLNFVLNINNADKDGDGDIDNLDEAIYDKMQFISFRSLLVIFNTIAAPIIVTLLLSDSCFKEFFSPRDPVGTDYAFWGCVSYTYNLLTNVFSCQTYDWTTQTTQYAAAFIYNSTCSASLFTSYIPAVLFGYATNFFVAWILNIFPALLGKERLLKLLCNVKLIFVSMFPEFLFISEEKVLSEESVGQDEKERMNNDLIPAADMMVLFVKDFSILLSFGFISPPLALAVFATIVFRSVYLQVLVGRFAGARKRNAQLMNEACVGTQFTAIRCLSLLMFSTGLFQSLIIFDMMCDKADVTKAIWPSIVLMILAFLIRLGIPRLARFFFGKRSVYPVNDPSDEEASKVAEKEPEGTPAIAQPTSSNANAVQELKNI